MGRFIALLYGGICYVLMLATFIYFYGFVTNVGVMKGVDVGEMKPLAESLPVNIGLLLLFAVQQIGMTRPGFRKVWTRVVPQPVERSTYVLISCALLALLFWQWRPMGPYLWDSHIAYAYASAYGIFVTGSFVVVAASVMTDHFELFGFRQVWMYVWGQEYKAAAFPVRWLYRFVRHPIYLGLIMMLWATPHMSIGRAVFAAGMTACFLVAIRFAERDLLAAHGDEYREYQQKVPMLFPLPGKSHPAVKPGA